MAKTNMIERDKRRVLVAKKYAARAREPEGERFAARSRLRTSARLRRRSCRRLPRDASPTRQRNRCAITGRSRGVYSKFGLARTKIREVAARGEIPGLAKASW